MFLIMQQLGSDSRPELTTALVLFRDSDKPWPLQRAKVLLQLLHKLTPATCLGSPDTISRLTIMKCAFALRATSEGPAAQGEGGGTD